MRLSSFSDYSLRVLLYVAVTPDRLVTIAEIAQSYDISENHLMKVVHLLGREGYVETVRGKKGGIRLAKAPRDIVIGDVVRKTESDMTVVECLGLGHCRIAPACRLKGIIVEALEALFLVLDGYTLADVLDHPLDELIREMQSAQGR